MSNSIKMVRPDFTKVRPEGRGSEAKRKRAVCPPTPARPVRASSPDYGMRQSMPTRKLSDREFDFASADTRRNPVSSYGRANDVVTPEGSDAEEEFKVPAPVVVVAEEVVPDNREEIEALLSKGEALYEIGEDKKAELTLRRALELSPKDQRINYALGECLRVQLKFEEAEGYLRVAIRECNKCDFRVRDRVYETNIALGNVLSMQRRYNEAMPFWRQAVCQDPADYSANFGYGECWMKVGNMAAAEEFLRKAIDVATAEDQNMGMLFFNMVKCLMALGKNEAANEYAGSMMDSSQDEAKAEFMHYMRVNNFL